jgi:hypothetical protein
MPNTSDGSAPVGETEFLRLVQRNDQVHATGDVDNQTWSSNLFWVVGLGETWVFDACLLFSGPGGYVAGVNPILSGDKDVGAASTTAWPTIVTFAGPNTALSVYKQVTRQGVGSLGAGGGPFGAFDMSGASAWCSVWLHGVFQALVTPSIIRVAFNPITNVTGNATLKQGSSLIVHRIDR